VQREENICQYDVPVIESKTHLKLSNCCPCFLRWNYKRSTVYVIQW